MASPPRGPDSRPSHDGGSSTRQLDHLVVAAATLPEGRSWVEDLLGVPMQDGGRHEAFGTHNALLRLGSSSYLEVIAVDPDAPAPARPRWFELDSPRMAERLARGPALVHWVVTVPLPALEHAGRAHGEPMALSRGANRWTLTVPEDGRLPMGGTLPSLIAWETPPPAGSLPDRRVELRQLALASPDPEALRNALEPLELLDPPLVAAAEQPGLSAVLQTPTGLVTL